MRRTLMGIELLLKAAQFAAEKHKNQRRKDAHATPYINHPLNLAYILSNEAGITDPTTLVAAILHDTIEDTETSEAEIQHHFGSEIAGIVREVTDNKSLSKIDRKRLQIKNGPKKSYKAKLVKFADKIANLRDIATHPPQDWSLARQQEYFEWAMEVINAMGETHTTLERLFKEAYKLKPTLTYESS